MQLCFIVGLYVFLPRQQASKQASKQAGRQAGKQASRQAVRQTLITCWLMWQPLLLRRLLYTLQSSCSVKFAVLVASQQQTVPVVQLVCGIALLLLYNVQHTLCVYPFISSFFIIKDFYSILFIKQKKIIISRYNAFRYIIAKY